MRIVPRAEWCRVKATMGPKAIPVRQDTLWLHHGASGQSSIATANAYARYHIQTLGWGEIGYSWLIAEGKVLEGRGPGRQGAHTRGLNDVSYGICVAGDYQAREPAGRDLDALVWLLRHGKEQGWWGTPKFTGGHRDAPGASTSCPGNRLHRMIPELNRRAATTSVPDPKDWLTMATEPDIRRIIREEIAAALADTMSGRDYGTDMSRLRKSVRAIAANQGLDTVHPVEDGYKVEA